jgi:hypothetical protein
VVLFIGLVAAAAMSNTPKAETDFSELTESEQGPLKL